MPTSDKELQKKQKDVAALREKLAATQSELLERERELANDVTAKELDDEAARIQAELDRFKEQPKAENVLPGTLPEVVPTAVAQSDQKGS